MFTPRMSQISIIFNTNTEKAKSYYENKKSTEKSKTSTQNKNNIGQDDEGDEGDAKKIKQVSSGGKAQTKQELMAKIKSLVKTQAGGDDEEDVASGADDSKSEG